MKLIKHASPQKLRGGFYTPSPIADFILDWAINGAVDYDILEPSCGDGVFLKSIKQKNKLYHSITAIELDTLEAVKAKQIKLSNTTVLNQDFHEFCHTSSQRFDLVVGNPPYIRYQYFDKEQQIAAAKIFEKVQLRYSKLTNAWVSFIVGSSILLKETGKIGFVVPAEILQVSYAKQLRKFLAEFYNKINILSFEELVFPNIQQEVVLLLCEKNNTQNHFIEHLEIKNLSNLSNIDVVSLKNTRKKINFKSNKWTYYFLEQKEIDFLETIAKCKNIPKIGDFAKVEVGMTTGANQFFTVPQKIVQQYDLQEFVQPLVGRSVQVKSLRFTSADWQFNRNAGAKTHFLQFPKLAKMQHNKRAIQYIEYGERLNVNKGYKCRIREEWQIVPSVWVPDGLFIRRNNRYPKLIVNEANAYTTDTMHRIRLKDSTDINAFTASFYNSLSFAFAEICGRSYGGGVLELMPSEVAQILLPYHLNHADLMLETDERMRKSEDIEKILSFTNQKILRESYGFSKLDIKLAHNIWKKLSERRLNRGKKSKKKKK